MHALIAKTKDGKVFATFSKDPADVYAMMLAMGYGEGDFEILPGRILEDVKTDNPHTILAHLAADARDMEQKNPEFIICIKQEDDSHEGVHILTITLVAGWK